MAADTKPSESWAAVQPPVSRLTTLKYHIRAYLFNRAIYWGLRALYLWESKFWAVRAPTTVKRYAVRPGLEVRIFLPPSAHPNVRAGAKLPLFFLLHGGGWVIGDARMDDEQAHMLAHKYGFCAASVEYGLSPSKPFPGPIHDSAALIHAVLADASLPIDRDRVVLGGFSAGATMTLALAQLPEFRDVLKALVAFYPVTDFSIRDRGPVATAPWGRREKLQARLPLYQWAYVPSGQDLRDRFLSPRFATRDHLAQPLFMVTATGDCLHPEAHETACSLAGIDKEEQEEIIGSDSWERNWVRHRRVNDMPHCFTHHFERIGHPLWEARRAKAVEEVWDEIHDWLKRVLLE